MLWMSLAHGQHAALDRELAAVAHDPALPLASLSVLAVRAGQVDYSFQSGTRQLDQPATSVGPDTLYRIASISKMVTAMGVMKLIEQHKLDLDTDVSQYLGYPLRNPAFPGQVITLRMLLSHTSSLRDGAGYYWAGEHPIGTELTRGDPSMWSSTAAPGQFFTYANLNWGVIGTLMEAVTGERFDLLMQRLLLQPMGISGGYFPPAFSDAELARLATLYRKRSTGTEIWDSTGPWIAQADDYRAARPHSTVPASYRPGQNATLFSPTGGLRISALGLGQLMQMLLQQGQYQGRTILQPDSIRLMFSQQWLYDGRNGDTEQGQYGSWGLGSQRFGQLADGRDRLVEDAGFHAVGHLGEAYGLLSTFAVDFERGIGMVVLIGGLGRDPALYPGQYSALTRSEERILTALYRHVTRRDAP
ncbi:serine hydrolase domain-containing protein [Duganella fentianensis]|nr:serine hydrolase [Duganella fentianensis]